MKRERGSTIIISEFNNDYRSESFSKTLNFRWYKVNNMSDPILQQMAKGSFGSEEWINIETVVGL